jgi:hypothetical protein
VREALRTLLSHSDQAFCAFTRECEIEIVPLIEAARSIGQELKALLQARNGFFAFDRALLVRSLTNVDLPLGVAQWNEPSLWKREYRANIEGLTFFAEDGFGGQFGIKGDAVCYFDPENGEMNLVAESLEAWARWLLQDHRVRTGWPLYHLWKERFGIVEAGQRLVPKIPFVLGGKFELANLYKVNDVEGMRWRAAIANQLLDCPPGTKVVIKTPASFGE